jgi:hypothetical protein
VIVAISLNPRTMVRSTLGAAGLYTQERSIGDAPADLRGPPYGVVETVCDEYDLECCYATPEETEVASAPRQEWEGSLGE